ncbi:MAG: carbohydrate ABC transporter permease, partial [Trebonia sp.]
MTVADLPVSAAAPRAARGRRRVPPGTIVKETLFYLAVIIVVLIALFPVYWILRTSLLSNQQVAAGVGGANGIIPSHLSGAAYKNVFTQGSFLRPLINSIIVSLATTVVTIVVGSMAGYALARLRIRGAGAILAFILLAGFFPVLAMIGPLFLVLRYIGALDSIWPLIIVYLVYTLPIATWLLKNFFEQIPAELEDAALVDGATRLQTLRKVVIPVAVPAVFTAAILSFILAWNDFAFAVSFLTSTSHFT